MRDHPTPLPPTDPLAAWRATPETPWNPRRAGHLLRRAGLGASPGSLEQSLRDGMAGSVKRLFDFDPTDDPFNDMIERLEGFVNLNDIRSLQGWWCHRLLNTPRPLQERMALIWHNHFATSAQKVENGQFMHQHIEMFRRMGLGSWRDLLVAVGRDPAMLIWLDGRTSRKGKPNENYAREVMELFTLGVGNYTEQDVQQLARCFTGWRIERNEGFFDARQHDDGEKTIFGQTGRWDDAGAVDLLLSRPQAAPFLARRLLREFVHPDPEPELVEALGRRVVHHKWMLTPILAELFSSRLFYSDYAYRTKIKSPVDLVIGVANAFGGRVNTNYTREILARMGQNLLYPPDVGGWSGQEAWINANTVLVRFNFALNYATQRNGQDFVRRSQLEAVVRENRLDTAEKCVDYFARLLLDGQLDPQVRQTFIDYMNRDERNHPKPFTPTSGNINSKVRGMLHLMMTKPQFQVG